MKTTLKIKNFKSLEDVEIELNPITVFLGPNGVGKSSVLQALTFVQKNILDRDYLFDEPTKYSLTNNIDLGSYYESVTNNDITKKIIIRLDHNSAVDEFLKNFDRSADNLVLVERGDQSKKEFLLSKKIDNIIDSNDVYEVLDKIFSSHSYRKSFIKKYSTNFNFSFQVEFAFTEDKDHFAFLELFDNELDAAISFSNGYAYSANHRPVSVGNELDDKILEFILDLDYLSFNVNIKKSERIIYSFWNFIQSELNKNTIWTSLEEKKRIEIFFRQTARILRLYYFFPQIINSFFYINHLPSVRPIPQRAYLLKNGKIIDTNYSNYVEHLPNKKKADEVSNFLDNNCADGELLKLRYEDNSRFYLANIFKQLRNLKLARSLYIEGDNDITKIFIENMYGICVNLAETSSGLQQILPIILHSNLDKVEFPKEQIIFIEQPELHLHPKLQANLADLISTKNNYSKVFPFFILETHSEHLVRKFQVLIAKKDLILDRITILYFDNKNGITKIKKMKLEENGFFKEPWPDGFFDDSYNLTKELLKANKK